MEVYRKMKRVIFAMNFIPGAQSFTGPLSTLFIVIDVLVACHSIEAQWQLIKSQTDDESERRRRLGVVVTKHLATFLGGQLLEDLVGQETCQWIVEVLISQYE